MSVSHKIREFFISVYYTAFPDDRPSAVFPLFGAIVNSIPLVWGFSMIPATECNEDYKVWASLGIFNCFVNMLFGITITFLTRRKIKAGIRARVTTNDLFLRSVVVDVFILYLLWEVVWLAVAASRSAEDVDDTCRHHLLVQVAFHVVYVVLGPLLFTFTFVTEWSRLPRWRAYAAMRYRYNGPQADPSSFHGGGEDNVLSDGGSRTRRAVAPPSAFNRHRTGWYRAEDVTAEGYDSELEARAQRGHHGSSEDMGPPANDDEDGSAVPDSAPRRVRFVDQSAGAGSREPRNRQG